MPTPFDLRLSDRRSPNLTHIRLHGCDNHHRFAVLLGSGGSFADGTHVLQQTIFTSCNVRQRTFFLPVSCVALADFLHRFCRFLGFVGWLFWSVVHIYFLITARDCFIVAFTWLWDYVTFQRGARLITEVPPERK